MNPGPPQWEASDYRLSYGAAIRREDNIEIDFREIGWGSCQFTSLRSKYSPEHPVLKHPQSMFLP
jgi:hypothetical protein